SLGALSRITPTRIAAEGALWAETFAPLPSPRIAVLLGGPSKSANWERRDHDRLIAQLKALESQGMGLIITPSRRTEPALTEAIRTACPRAYIWDMTGENPYPGLLAHADAVVVTEDSVNMASEAASTGLPVHVFRISALALKLKRFHARLEDHGAARVFSGPIRYWDYPPLAEADRIAEALIQRLGLALG
ncbi:MAG: mitochondrial fission ELM1 family protein, partial [Pseudomonadota bacterium]